MDSESVSPARRRLGRINLLVVKVGSGVIAGGGRLRQRVIADLAHDVTVLAHQGRFEFGSPVQPATAEAIALHAIDDLDSKLAVLRDLRQSQRGFVWVRSLERFVSPIELHDVSVVPVIEESGSVAGVVNALVTSGGHDLVVVGTRGRSPSAAVLLGSESEHVLVESRVPVLITKEPGERIGVLQALLDRNFQARREPRFG